METPKNPSKTLYARIISLTFSIFFTTIIPVFITLLIFSLFLISSAKAAKPAARLTVETYCQLSIDLMELAVNDWKIRTSLLKEYGKNPENLNKIMTDHDYAYKKKRNSLFNAYDATFLEYSHFNSRKQKAVKKYLKGHIIVKTRMHNLSKAIDKQIQIYDAVEASFSN